MALYKYQQVLAHSNHQAFDELHTPGTAATYSGIYRCQSCGDEIAANAGNPLPPQNHRQHNPNAGPIRWRLIVGAQQT